MRCYFRPIFFPCVVCGICPARTKTFWAGAQNGCYKVAEIKTTLPLDQAAEHVLYQRKCLKLEIV
jgi:hypothetical protein